MDKFKVFYASVVAFLASINSFFDQGLKNLIMSLSAFLVTFLTSNEAQAVAALLGLVSVCLAIRYYFTRQKVMKKLLDTPMDGGLTALDIQKMLDDKLEDYMISKKKHRGQHETR